MSLDVFTKWTELKALIEAIESDVLKNARGVAAAGVRARKGLRQLQANARDLVKSTIELEKAEAAKKPAKPKKTKQ